MSRNVNAHLFYSLNGVSESPHTFQFDAFGEVEGKRMDAALAPVTEVVIGRKLWQEWRGYWTTEAGAKDDFGAFINPIRKHVVTSTLTGDLDWNSTPVTGDPVAYVNELKQGEGGDIAVVGGVETVRSLFDDSVPLTRLELVDSGTSKLGNVFMSYRLRGNA